MKNLTSKKFIHHAKGEQEEKTKEKQSRLGDIQFNILQSKTMYNFLINIRETEK